MTNGYYNKDAIAQGFFYQFYYITVIIIIIITIVIIMYSSMLKSFLLSFLSGFHLYVHVMSSGTERFVSIHWARNPQYALAEENGQLRFSIVSISLGLRTIICRYAPRK